MKKMRRLLFCLAVVIICAGFVIGFVQIAGDSSLLKSVVKFKENLPDGYSILKNKEYDVITNVANCDLNEIDRAFSETQQACAKLTGQERQEPEFPLHIFFAQSKKNLQSIFWQIFGEKYDVQGISLPSASCVFASEEAGIGTIRHELVHVFIHADFPKIPGWFDESLAHTLGSKTKVTIQMHSKVLQITDYFGYMGLQAVKQGKWTPLEQIFRHRERGYNKLTEGEFLMFSDLSPNATFQMMPLSSGVLFVRWMHEHDFLPRFYKAYRNSCDYSKALSTISRSDLASIEQEVKQWVLDQDMESLVRSYIPQSPRE